VLLAETTLARGETRPVQSAGKLIIYASVTENLQVDTATQSIKLAEWKARLNGSPYVNFPP